MVGYISKDELQKQGELMYDPKAECEVDATSFVVRMNYINSMQPADVVEREKIDKAIEEITKLKDSTSRMITEEPNLVNECYEQYVNCFNECLKIIKRNIGESNVD